ncbi:hypothetical protein QA634_07785 [Methylobacterium sp. CB376]|nr:MULTISPECIES: hypothetical protein [Methylobacterium]WFT81749.1 hypothetical protein QA634_07785 [Methylobacterium nodulans]
MLSAISHLLERIVLALRGLNALPVRARQRDVGAGGCGREAGLTDDV